MPPRYEINFELPRDMNPGPHELRMRLGKRSYGPIMLDLDYFDGELR